MSPIIFMPALCKLNPKNRTWTQHLMVIWTMKGLSFEKENSPPPSFSPRPNNRIKGWAYTRRFKVFGADWNYIVLRESLRISHKRTTIWPGEGGAWQFFRVRLFFFSTYTRPDYLEGEASIVYNRVIIILLDGLLWKIHRFHLRGLKIM